MLPVFPYRSLSVCIISWLWIGLQVGGLMKYSRAQQTAVKERTRILLLLDASGSMHQPWTPGGTETRMISAKKILNEIMDSLEHKSHVELALRVYGHQSPLSVKDCKDTRLEVGFGRNNIPTIKAKLKTINPKGITPIAYSLQQASNDFPDNIARNIVILMTDGEESCGGDPCAVAYELEKKKIVLKHFAIGIGISDAAAATFRCFSNFYNVNDQQSFKNVLSGIINKVTHSTTTQVYLLDKYNKPTEADIHMTFYDAYNKNLRYNYYQTLDGRGMPDTLIIDPISDYDIHIHTLPALMRNQVEIIPNRHNVIVIPAAQGSIEFTPQGKLPQQQLADKIKCIVHQGKEIIHVQSLYHTSRYLADTYQVEILTLPRIRLDKVMAEANSVTKIEIVSPGMVTLQKRYDITGGIFALINGKVEKVTELTTDSRIETVALQPGKYYLIYRIKNSRSIHSSKTHEFEVKSGENHTIVVQ